MQILTNKLKEYGTTNPKKVQSRQEVLDNAKNLYATRNDIINALDQGIFFTQKSNIADKQINMPALEEKQTKKEIPDWVLINKFNFDKIKKEVDDAVNNKRGPKRSGKKISYFHLQNFLQDIINGEFNNAEESTKILFRKHLQ